MIKLLGSKIAVIPIEDPIKTKSGLLYKAEMYKQRVDQGIVKYVGPEVKDLKRGDHVLFSGYDGDWITIEDEGVLVVMHEETVDAILLDKGQPLFPLTQCIQIIDSAEGEFRFRETEGGEKSIDPALKNKIEYFCEILKSKFTDWLSAEGFQF